ncbi:translation initiation factor eIF-2B [Candidatus Pacearchaeota archaeon]|nr:translation initiation factor eIF-2B [Candidatus Pacearchaeota archaeon]
MYAYSLLKTREAKHKLIKARPTEPMLSNVLRRTEKQPYKKILQHFDEAQEKINKHAFKIIKNNSIIFTHCHSTNVANALIYAKKHGKKFQVYNTETRPLFQGRKTSRQLSKAGIRTITFVDSAAGIAIKKSGAVFFGADALLKDGVINKVGSGMFAEIARDLKKPVYIIADSWKYSPKNLKIEERDFREVWKNAPRRIKIKNPAFEKIEKKYIKAVVSELGVLKFGEFVKRAGKNL